MKAVSVTEVQKNSLQAPSVGKPNGQRCKHPREMRWNDLENGETVCTDCGEVLRERVGPVSLVIGGEKHGRGPTNDVNFKSNLGSNSRGSGGGPEHHHLDAISSMYGGHGWRDALIQTKTCPKCDIQQPVKIMNENRLICEREDCGTLTCNKCIEGKEDRGKEDPGEISEGDNGNLRCSKGPLVSEGLVCSKYGEINRYVKFIRTHLGDYYLRWNPSNGNGFASSYWADLRLLQAWDPPENDVNIKLARELLKEKLLTRVSPEDAHRLSSKYLQGVRKISRIPRKTLIDLLDGVLESEGVRLEN